MSGSTHERRLARPAAQAVVWFCVPIVLLACVLSARFAAAETRVALVIGNTAYEHAPPLANPVNDARGMAAALRRLDFDVQESIDLDMVGMRRALRDFAGVLENADVGLFFYAGHALQVDGQNYLAPIDAKLERSSDLIFQAVELNLVLRLLQERPRTSIIFLDACRDNPLTRSLARGLGQARSQAIGQGLADVDSGIGTLIAYATQPDNIALDGKGQHSPFTKALLEHIETPGLEVRQMLSRVRRTVIDTTVRRQVPWDHSSLTGDFFFELPEPAEAQPEPVPPPFAGPRSTDDVVVWSVIQWSVDAADFELFLRSYPNSPLAPFAQSRLAGLRLGAEQKASGPPIAPRPQSDEEDVAAQDTGPQPTRFEGPLTPGSTAAPPPADRIGADLATATLPDAGLVEEEVRPDVRPAPAGRVTAALTEAPPYVEPTPEPVSAEQARADESALGLSREDWRMVQRALNALEHPAGPEDGLPGPQTRAALEAWQEATDVRPTGYLTAVQVADLQEEEAGSRLAAVPTTAPPTATTAALPATSSAAAPATGSVARPAASQSTRQEAILAAAPAAILAVPIHDCDRLAAQPADRARVGAGVAWQSLDPARASAACETAIEEHPDELRFQHQYGWAQLKAGRLDDARLWFRTAAENGYVAAQKHVGHMYMMSLGVPADDSKAVSWYRKAAEQNDPGAQYLLGLMHVLGRGVPRDDMQAITWFRRAAGQGDAGAQFILGWMYRQGRGVQSIASDGPPTAGRAIGR